MLPPGQVATRSGYYPAGEPGVMREWDGHAWTDSQLKCPAVAALPTARAHGFDFLGDTWFVIGITGLLASVVLAAAYGFTGFSPLLFAAGFSGAFGVLASFTLFVWQRLNLGEVVSLLEIAALGVAGGGLAFGLAFALETTFREHFGSEDQDLFGLVAAGPIEEVSKLLVPAIVYFAVRNRFRDPRAGLAVALASAFVLGLIENIDYVNDLGQTQAGTAIQQASSAVVFAVHRPFVELAHLFWTGFVAAVIWRVAWRHGRFFSAAGFGALGVAVAAHSANNALSIFWWSDYTAWVILIGSYLLLFRREASQLTPPHRLADCRPSWRPIPLHMVPGDYADRFPQSAAAEPVIAFLELPAAFSAAAAGDPPLLETSP